MRNRFRRTVLALLCAPLGSIPEAALAQWPPLTTPLPSPAASVSQTVGVTRIEIDYARPQVKGRKIWGALVPYGAVWRAGANTNTAITFSTAVTVGGKSLPAGTYGLHMIPTEKDWTVILSRDAVRWGSFGYDEKNDAARFTITPAAGPMTESLTYTFDAVDDDSAEVVLSWETVRAAFPVEVDTRAETIAALRSDLTGLAQFFWQPWNIAANYAIDNSIALDEAAVWIRRSIGINENFVNSKTQAKLMRLNGDAAGADALLARALGGASEAEVNQHGYELLGEGQRDEAIATFRRNVKDHPRSWNTYDSLGEALVADPGTLAEGVAMYRKALSLAPAAQKPRIEAILSRLSAKT